MLRTDDMEYNVRPLDHKHPRILPVGQDGEFNISKDVIEMSIPDGDHKKLRYQVIAMKTHRPFRGGSRRDQHQIRAP